MSTLVQQYETLLTSYLQETGFPRPPALMLHHDNRITMAVMAVPQQTIFRHVMQRFMTDLTVKEMIFGVDRYAKPGQGTKYAYVLTVFWWQGARDGHHGFRFGVVNYQPPPHTVIEPIDWDNAFWNRIMAKIVSEDHERNSRRIEAVRNTLGGDAMVDAAIEAIRAAKERVSGEKL